MEKRFYMKEGGGRPRVFVVLFAFLFFFLVILLGLYILGLNSKKTANNHSISSSLPSLTPLPVSSSTVSLASASGTLSPFPTTSVLDRKTLRLSVLNGSGIPGAAKGISTRLSQLGYDVVTVGNADNYDFRNVTVTLKKSKSQYVDLLRKDLESQSGSISASFSDEILNDGEVVVGK